MKVVAINGSPFMGKGNTGMILSPFLEGMRESHVWVLATPAFVHGISGPLKCVLDRMIPMLEPFVELREGRCRHPRREGSRGGQVEDVLDAAREAGRQLVHTGAMSPETLDTVSRELLPLETYVEILNQRFQQALERVES